MPIIIVRPIVFFDLETTGVKISFDRIVQIAAIKIFPDGSMEEKQTYVNPGIPIPAEATAVHGITDEMVKDAPTFKQLSKSLYVYMKDSDLGGYNSDNFDIPLLGAEFNRVGLEFGDWEMNLMDVLKNERRLAPQKLGDIYFKYTGQVLENAHDAMADVKATVAILDAQCKNEEVTIMDIDLMCQGENLRFDLAGKMYMKDGEVFWNFGKNKDKPIKSDHGYLTWALNWDEMPQQSRKCILNYIGQNNSK